MGWAGVPLSVLARAHLGFQKGFNQGVPGFRFQDLGVSGWGCNLGRLGFGWGAELCQKDAASTMATKLRTFRLNPAVQGLLEQGAGVLFGKEVSLEHQRGVSKRRKCYGSHTVL